MRKMTVALVAGLAAATLAGCAAQTPAAPAASAPAASVPAASAPAASAPAQAAAGTVTCTYTPSGTAAKAVNLPNGTNVPATGTTSLTLMLNDKPVQLTLDRAKAPCTVNSFVSLASQGYFDNTSCHRLTTSGIFVLQCGDPTGTGTGGPGYSFGDELAGITGYPAGTLAMANAGPNTNGSQFFIVYQDTQLSPAYTVFGTVSATGMDVVNAIAAGGTDNSNGQGDGKPLLPAKITSVTAG